MVRLSSALKSEDISDPLIPGMGLKFFLDGHPSRDLVAMNSVDG
jgi:hypothetical protein